MEAIVSMAVARDGDRVHFGVFRPCFVIAPEEWQGAPTQQGHGVAERLDRPELGAVSLFNYVDARDVSDFVLAWIARSNDAPNGEIFFVGAEDALARESLSTLLPPFLADSALDGSSALVGSAAAFSVRKARELLGWRPVRSWRSELQTEPVSEAELDSPELERSAERTTAP